MKERKLLKIKYLDHVSADHQTDGLKELEKTEPMTCVAYGELMKETESFVTLLCSYDNE